MNLFHRLSRYLINKVLQFLSPVVKVLEDLFFIYNVKDCKSPVFIVGAPRTGSTVLYQALTNAYKVGYIDNLSCFLCRNLRLGLWLSYMRYRGRPHNNFNAEYGDTSKYGGHSPSECGAFWYRWLPKDTHFVDYNQISRAGLEEIRNEVLGATAYLDMPIVFKNLNAGQRLRLVSQVFPDAKIIFIRRDPRFVVRSILKARKNSGVKENQWWSIRPKNYLDLLQLPEKDMCTAQVFFLEQQIKEDIALFPEENVKFVNYNDIDSALIEELGNWLHGVPQNAFAYPAFSKDDFDLLSHDEKIELNRLVAKFEFDEDLFFV